MGRQRGRGSANVVLGTVVGVLCGLFLGMWARSLLAPCNSLGGCCEYGNPAMGADIGDPGGGGDSQGILNPKDGNSFDLPDRNIQKRTDDEESAENLVLVGVMTARKYLSSRIVAAYQTWRKSIPGKVLYFAAEGSELPEHPEIPIVALQGVDDTYPPQKKSFLMFKYMHDHYGTQFKWFMRADDDVYIKGDKLGKFLNSINSSRPWFIGQAGLGTAEEFGLLSLDQNDNFCMGGPGIIMSQTTLQKMVPNVGYCLKNLYTTHEDVEIGRCVRKWADTHCTWAFEMQQLFYHNHKEPNGAFTHPLNIKEVHRAITMHPFKNHTYQYRMHNYQHSRHTMELRQRTLFLHREITEFSNILKDRPPPNDPKLSLQPSLMKYAPKKKSDALAWEFVTSKQLISHFMVNPKRGIEQPWRIALDDVLMQVMQKINHNQRQRGRTIDFKEVLYGYKRVNPMHGADYILDLLLIYRKYKGRKMTVPVRRHAYLQQTFTALEFTEDTGYEGAPPTNPPTTTQRSAFFQRLQQLSGRLGLYNSGQANSKPWDRDPALAPHPNHNKTIHFIMPLAGRFQTFLQYMGNFEDVCLKSDDKVVLVVVLFHSETDDRTEDTIDHIRQLQAKYPVHDLRVLQMKGAFSRGIALEQGSAAFPNDSLLYFIDVDIYFSKESLNRIRMSTIYGKQMYFPIVFSQYDPKTFCEKPEGCGTRTNPFQFSEDQGYWRQFGFGIACMYHGDLKKAGGFDSSIVGWGKEDVDLFNRVVGSNYTIFRAADPGMVHIFHPINCDPSLEPAQYQMCLGSKVATFGSTQRLANIVYNTTEILHRNENADDDAAIDNPENAEELFEDGEGDAKYDNAQVDT